MGEAPRRIDQRVVTVMEAIMRLSSAACILACALAAGCATPRDVPSSVMFDQRLESLSDRMERIERTCRPDPNERNAVAILLSRVEQINQRVMCVESNLVVHIDAERGRGKMVSSLEAKSEWLAGEVNRIKAEATGVSTAVEALEGETKKTESLVIDLMNSQNSLMEVVSGKVLRTGGEEMPRLQKVAEAAPQAPKQEGSIEVKIRMVNGAERVVPLKTVAPGVYEGMFGERYSGMPTEWQLKRLYGGGQ